jgi:transaldolase
MTDRLKDLADAGISIWLDDLSRERLVSGNLAELIRDKHVVGVTTNPTIFATALADGEAYDEQVRELAERGASLDDVVRELTTTDVRNACDLFRDVWKATDGVDGRVSIEVDPRLAHDTDKTVAEALDLWKTVDRPNLYVKIPATKAGLPAITATLAEGINVNVTLIFSVQRYREVMAAYIAGLEQAKANGHAVSAITSVASFFVSRMDTEVDKRLEAIGSEEALAMRGKAAVANAVLAYAAYEEVFADGWSADIAGSGKTGGRTQRPLWASTGTKNPDYKDTKYIEELIVADTVNTMPEKTMLAFADHGEVPGDTVSGLAADAQQVFAALAAVGIDVDDVYEVLESEGVEKFEKSWTELLETVQGQFDKAQGKG